MKMTLTQAITELEKLAADNEYIVVDEGTNECGSDYSIEHANTEHWDEIEVDYEPGSRCIDSDLYIYIDSKPYDAFGQLVSPNNDDLCWIYVKDNRSISTVIEYEGCNPNVCITDLADELVAYFPEAFAETKGTDGLCWVTF
jgi:hypothetical protein